MARYNCPEEGCNVYFNNTLDDILPLAIDHAFGSHGKIIDKDAVVGVVKGQVQAEEPFQQEPAFDKENEGDIKVVRKRRRRKKRKKRQVKIKEQIESELADIYTNPIEPEIKNEVQPEVKPETKNKIFDWWGNKK